MVANLGCKVSGAVHIFVSVILQRGFFHLPGSWSQCQIDQISYTCHHLIASTRRSSVLASLIDFLFISVRDSARAFLCRLVIETSFTALIPKWYRPVYAKIQDPGEKKKTYAPCSWKFWETGLSATQHLQYLESLWLNFNSNIWFFILAELVLLRLPWHLLVLVLKDPSVVRHRAISEGA